MTTLMDARNEWQKTIASDGGYCPCCDRWGKMYRRGINRVMAASMVWLARHGPAGGDWVDVPRVAPRFVLASNQFTTMRWWGMCVRCEPTAEEDKKFSGRWRMTDLGMGWVGNLATVPKYVWTYNDAVHSFDGPQVRIGDCLEAFSYNDVMNTNFQK